MIKKLIIILLVSLMYSCSMNTRLSKKYEGKGVEVLYKELGSPKAIQEGANGNRIFEYQKETFIKETEFGTGRATLDPRISPSYIKLETFYFEVDANGIVVGTGYKKSLEK